MPKDEWDPEDPMEFMGVRLPVPTEAEADEMVVCLVDEFVRMGFGEEQLLGLFRDPFYAATHDVWRRKGEAYVRDVIGRVLASWAQPGRPV